MKAGHPEGQPAIAKPQSTGALLLDELHAALTRYVVLPSAEAADAAVLWITATHAIPAWNCAPRLNVTSPVKRCGKSRLLDIIEATCHRPLITVNISPAALVRSISEDPPTLLLDEADTVFGRKAADGNEDLRGILNAGHSRNRPYIRWDVTMRTAEHCPTFAMAALAGIGGLPDTITDRAVVIPMRRRAPGETVARFRDRRDGGPLRDLGERLNAWVRDYLWELRDAEPDMPVEDRAADTWEPLIAVADLAGGDWPARARSAAIVLTADDDTDTSLGARLLADLRKVFGDADAMHGETILAALYKIDESPWGDYFGHPMNAREMAKLLRPYKITSADVKLNGVNRKGYRREHLHDAWSRYLPPAREGGATSATPATAQVSSDGQVAGSGQEALPATSLQPLTREVAGVAEVADPPPGALKTEILRLRAEGKTVQETAAITGVDRRWVGRRYAEADRDTEMDAAVQTVLNSPLNGEVIASEGPVRSDSRVADHEALPQGCLHRLVLRRSRHRRSVVSEAQRQAWRDGFTALLSEYQVR